MQNSYYHFLSRKQICMIQKHKFLIYLNKVYSHLKAHSHRAKAQVYSLIYFALFFRFVWCE